MKQSLALDTRRAGAHLIRFGLGSVLLVAVAVAHSQSNSSPAGLALFRAQMLISLFYLSMDGVFSFSQIITEERDEGTLDLLRLAEINSLSVILGRTAGRLWDASLLIAVQLPFSLLCVTLGGVAWEQVWLGYLLLLAYAWLLCGVGLWCSVWQPTSATAAGAAALFVLGYTAIPIVDEMFLSMVGSRVLRGALNSYLLSIQIKESASTFFNQQPDFTAVWMGCALGLGGLLTGWLGLEYPALTKMFAYRGFRRKLSKRPRVTWPPVAWRACRYQSGGIRGMILRLVGLAAFSGLMHGLGPTFVDGAALSLLFGGAICILDATWVMARLFHEEIRERTWGTLVLTSRPVTWLMWDKFRGWLRASWPLLLAPVVFCGVLCTAIAQEPYSNGLKHAFEFAAGVAVSGVAVLLYLHVLIYWSLTLGWKAIPPALTVFVTSYVLYIIIMEKLRISHNGFVTMCLVTDWALLVGIGIMQLVIIRKLTRLAANE